MMKNGILKCLAPCKTEFVSSSSTILSNTGMYIQNHFNYLLVFQKLISFLDFPEYADNYNTFWLTLGNRLETNYIEYYVYDITAVVSSIGGGIGIFLGYSCFGVASSVLKKFFEAKKPQDVHPVQE